MVSKSDLSNPKAPGDNGPSTRDMKGRFGAGNKFGKGNPNHKRAALFKEEALKQPPERATEILNKWYEMALDGDVPAGVAWFNRTAGRVTEVVADDADGNGLITTSTLDAVFDRLRMRDEIESLRAELARRDGVN